MAKISVPAGRYFLGDVTGLTRPIVAIPARASIFYSDCGEYEIEIAGGGSSGFVDETKFGVFGLIEFDATGLEYDDYDYLGVDLTSETEVEYDFDYLRVGDIKFSVCRDAGLKFTDTEAEFDMA